MAVKFANNVSTTLSAAINATQTTISVADASGLPTLSSGDYVYLTLDTDTNSPTIEVVKVTAISSNDLTVVRGQDGTTASSFSNGTKIELRVTAAALDDISSAADTESVSIDGDTMTGKLTINNANYASHLELVRGSDTLYLTPSGGQLITNGGLSPDVTNTDDLGRSDKYWQDLWLGTSLKMGGTTVIDSSRNLTNIGTISSGAITSSGGGTFNNETYVRGASNVGLHIQTTAQGTGGSDGLRVGLNSVHAFVWQYEALPLAFATSGTERLSISATGGFDFKGGNFSNVGTISSGAITSSGNVHLTNGNVTIGDLANANSGSLYLRGSTANKEARLFCTNGNLHMDSASGNLMYLNYYNGDGIYFGNGATGTNANIAANGNFTTSGTISSGAITSSGDIDAAGDIYTGSSNSRFKENQLRFNASGASYIDQATTGQTLYFRTSNNSSLDTTWLEANSAGQATFGGNVIVEGNLTVSGTQTTLNTATLQVEDKNIVLNYGSGDTSGSANGAGITIQDAVNSTTDATIEWSQAGNNFNVSHGWNTLGYLQHAGVLYSRNNLLVLNSAGNGWNTWATRSNGIFNLNVGTISSGAINASSIITGSGATGSVIGGVRAYGSSNAYMGASDGAGRTAFFGVDSSGYAMFGALTNHDAVIRANNSERLRAKVSGNVNIHVGGLEIGGTTVIDSSRNLANIGTVSSTHFTSSANINSTGVGGITVGGGRLGFDQSGVRSWTQYAAGGNLLLASGDGNGAIQANNFTASTYQINSTTVIDSSRNATLHDITTDGVVRSTNNTNVDGPNFNVSTTNKSTSEYAYRVDRSGTVVGGIRIDGRVNAQTVEVGGTTVIDSSRNVYANQYYYADGKIVVQATDSYLRLNQSNQFGSGIWVGSSRILQASAYIATGSNGSSTTSRVYMYGGTYDGTNVIALDGTDGKIKGSYYAVGGTTVIDSSRNLTNIGTYSGAGDVVAQAANVLFHARSSADGQTVGFRAGYLNHTTLQAFFRYTTGDAQLYIDNDFQGNNSVYSNINFRNKANNGTSLINRMTIHGSTGHVNITGGALQMGGTTVIDSSRNVIAQDISVGANGTITRSNHHSGHLEGSYNNVGNNAAKSNPIYTIGSNYNPTDAAISGMYGIGFTKKGNATFLSGFRQSGWGLYVASDGNARVWLNAQTGVVASTAGYDVGNVNVIDSSRNIQNVPVIYGNGGSTAIELNHATYLMLSNPEGARCLYLGDSGDRGNYYDNDTHYFRTAASAVIATINSSLTDLQNNLKIRGTQGFNATGETASIYLGDNNSEIRATYNGGTSFYLNAVHRMEIEGSTGNLNLITGNLEINGTTVIDSAREIKFTKGSSGTLASRTGFSDFIGYNPSYGSYIGGGANNGNSWIYSGGYISQGGVHTLWHSGNDGSGSGLDADLLDGQHGSYYQPASSAITTSSTQSNALYIRNVNPTIYLRDTDHLPSMIHQNSNLFYVLRGASNDATGWTSHGSGAANNAAGKWPLEINITDSGNYVRFASSALQAGGYTVWHTGNDGAGSGLDADAVDGLHSSSFARSNAAWTSAAAWKQTFHSGSGGATFASNHYSMGVDVANGAWSSPNYSDLIIGYHTGIRIGAGYSGIRFYNNSPTTDANNDGNGDGNESLLMTIGGGGTSTSGANVTINNDLYMGDNVHVSTNKGFVTDGAWIRNQTAHGYIDLGPANSSHAHIYTDRSNFYFNKTLIYADGNTMWHAGNDGSGSGLDADLLDGVNGASYLRSDADDSFTANHLSFPTLHLNISNNNSAGGYNTYFRGDSTHFVLGLASGNTFYCNYGNGAGDFRLDGNVYHNSSLVGNKIWGNSNDGSGSGLDADLLDGQQGSYYFSPANYPDRTNFENVYNNLSTSTGASADLNTTFTGSAKSGHFDCWGGNGAGSLNHPPGTTHVQGIQTRHTTPGHYGWQIASQYNQSAIWKRYVSNGSFSSWHQIWTSGTDGSGSGLDADLLDGIDSSSFIRSDADDLVTGHTEWQDSYQIRLGNGADMRMWHDGSNHYFRNYLHTGGDIYFQGEDSNGSNRALIYMITNSSAPYVQLFHVGNEKLRTVSEGINVYGDLTATGNVTAYSDIRKKTNIKPLEGGLDIVKALEPKRFDWIESGEGSLGFIAQEVEEYLPELVETKVDDIVEIDEEQNPVVVGEEEVKSLDYGKMVSVLWAAVKEQAAQIESLNKRIQELENGNN